MRCPDLQEEVTATAPSGHVFWKSENCLKSRHPESESWTPPRAAPGDGLWFLLDKRARLAGMVRVRRYSGRKQIRRAVRLFSYYFDYTHGKRQLDDRRCTYWEAQGTVGLLCRERDYTRLAADDYRLVLVAAKSVTWRRMHGWPYSTGFRPKPRTCGFANKGCPKAR